MDHDNIKYLKKILDELEKVLDQVETELQRRNEETPGREFFIFRCSLDCNCSNLAMLNNRSAITVCILSGLFLGLVRFSSETPFSLTFLAHEDGS